MGRLTITTGHLPVTYLDIADPARDMLIRSSPSQFWSNFSCVLANASALGTSILNRMCRKTLALGNAA